MDSARAGVASNTCTDTFGQISTPGSCESDPRRVHRGREPGIAADAKWAIGHLKCRQLQTGHRANGESCSANVVQFLLNGHPAQNRLDAVVRRIGQLTLSR